MKKMSCEDFNEKLFNDGFYSEIHSEMFFENNFNSEKVLKLFLSEAKKQDIELTNINDFDYDKEFFLNYKSDDDKSIS